MGTCGSIRFVECPGKVEGQSLGASIWRREWQRICAAEYDVGRLNYWLFCDNKEKLECMVNDIIEELLDLDMDPKPESLW